MFNMWDTNDQSALIGGLKSFEYGQIPLTHAHAHTHVPNPIQAHIHNQNHAQIHFSHNPAIAHTIPNPHHAHQQNNMPTYVQLLPNPNHNLAPYKPSNILPPKPPQVESNFNNSSFEKRFNLNPYKASNLLPPNVLPSRPQNIQPLNVPPARPQNIQPLNIPPARPQNIQPLNVPPPKLHNIQQPQNVLPPKPQNIQPSNVPTPKPPEIENNLSNSESEKRFACSYCPQTFSRAPYLKRHERIHTGTFSHTCEICNKGFRDQGYYKRHMDSHFPGHKYSCDKCNTTFKSYNGFKKHTSKSGDECPKRRVQNTEAESEVNEKLFECDFENCDKKYKTHPELVAHYRKHTGEKIFQCHLCSESFFTQRGLKVHLFNEHSVDGTYVDEKGETIILQTFKCESCGKFFKFSGDIRKHELIHSALKPFICEFCNKAFNKSSPLKWPINNQAAVDDDKAYLCKACDRGFSTKASLSAHEKTHLTDRPRDFQCQDCDKSFTSNRSLRIHQSSHSDNKPFNCDQCSRGFTQRNHFIDHMKMHENNLSFSCKMCPKKYNVKSRLRKHILYNHPNYSTDDDESQLNPDDDLSPNDSDQSDIEEPQCISENSSNTGHSNPNSVPVITRNDSQNIGINEPYQLANPMLGGQIPFIEPPNPSIPVPVPLSQQSCFNEEPGSSRTYTAVGQQPVRPVAMANIQNMAPGTSNQNLGAGMPQNAYTQLNSIMNMAQNLARVQNQIQSFQATQASAIQNQSVTNLAMVQNQIQNFQASQAGSVIQNQNATNSNPLNPVLKTPQVAARGQTQVQNAAATPAKRNQSLQNITMSINQSANSNSTQTKPNNPANSSTEVIPQLNFAQGIILPIPEVPPDKEIMPEAIPSAPLFVVKMRSYTDRPPEVKKKLEEVSKVKEVMDFEVFNNRSTDSDSSDSDNTAYKERARKSKNYDGQTSKHNSKKLHCKTCNKAFSRSSSLKRHARSHSSGKTYECDVCQKGFRSKAQYKTHKLTHSDKKQFKCKKCARKFKSYGGYRTHVNKNTCKKRRKKAPKKKRVIRRKKTDETSFSSESEEMSEHDLNLSDNSNDNFNNAPKEENAPKVEDPEAEPINPETAAENLEDKSDNGDSDVPRRTLRKRKPNTIIYFTNSDESNDEFFVANKESNPLAPVPNENATDAPLTEDPNNLQEQPPQDGTISMDVSNNHDENFTAEPLVEDRSHVEGNEPNSEASNPNESATAPQLDESEPHEDGSFSIQEPNSLPSHPVENVADLPLEREERHDEGNFTNVTSYHDENVPALPMTEENQEDPEDNQEDGEDDQDDEDSYSMDESNDEASYPNESAPALPLVEQGYHPQQNLSSMVGPNTVTSYPNENVTNLPLADDGSQEDSYSMDDDSNSMSMLSQPQQNIPSLPYPMDGNHHEGGGGFSLGH